MKTCTLCKTPKPLTAFYRHKEMADGHIAQCKECVKARVRRYRKKNLGRIQECDRQRGQHKDRKAANRRRYHERISTPEGRAAEWERQRRWQEANKLKRAVHIIVGNALKTGKIKRPDKCEKCGNPDPEAHHEDYSEPFQITWLCKPCHGARHREINEEARRP